MAAGASEGLPNSSLTTAEELVAYVTGLDLWGRRLHAPMVAIHQPRWHRRLRRPQHRPNQRRYLTARDLTHNELYRSSEAVAKIRKAEAALQGAT